MKRIAALVIVFSLMSIVLTRPLFSQGAKVHRGGGGWGPAGNYARQYDISTVETITGEVTKVIHQAPLKGMSPGIHLIVKTNKEEIAVHLGPAWFIDNQETKITAKDRVEITGSRINIDGKPAIVAAEVKKGDETLQLRNDKGYPAWSGWRRR